MLLNHALHLRTLGRAGEADRVSRHALTPPRDFTSVFHEWCCWRCLRPVLPKVRESD
jgi:hypothetical protein